MKILKDGNNYFGTNSYLIYDENILEGYLIDAPSKIKKFEEEISNNGINLKYLILTHGHYDHIVEANYWKEKYKIPIVAHEKEKLVLNNKDINLSKLLGNGIEIDADIYLIGDGEFEIFEYVHTPGHTQGGICLRFKEHLFTGDTLFRGSIGRTDFPTGDYDTLIKSIINKLGKFDENSIIYPGHQENSILGYEFRHNPFLR